MLTFLQIWTFLSEWSIDISSLQESLIFDRFKKQVFDKVTYAEFIEEITPRC